MATISSHVLDSVIGTHAAQIRVQCFARSSNNQHQQIFDVIASDEGRISETFTMNDSNKNTDYDVVFHSAAYYKKLQLPDDGIQIVKTIVLRISLSDPEEKVHLPVMLSPHSYSVWWSGNPPAVS